MLVIGWAPGFMPGAFAFIVQHGQWAMLALLAAYSPNKTLRPHQIHHGGGGLRGCLAEDCVVSVMVHSFGPKRAVFSRHGLRISASARVRSILARRIAAVSLKPVIPTNLRNASSCFSRVLNASIASESRSIVAATSSIACLRIICPNLDQININRTTAFRIRFERGHVIRR